MSNLSELRRLVAQHPHLELREPLGFHAQVINHRPGTDAKGNKHSSYLVNYYHDSKKLTLYVNPPHQLRMRGVTPHQAVIVALNYGRPRAGTTTPKPDGYPSKSARSLQTRRAKDRAFKGVERVPCFYCGVLITRKQARGDHLVPISKGGANAQGNIVIACIECDAAKGDSMPWSKEEEEA